MNRCASRGSPNDKNKITIGSEREKNAATMKMAAESTIVVRIIVLAEVLIMLVLKTNMAKSYDYLENVQ